MIPSSGMLSKILLVIRKQLPQQSGKKRIASLLILCGLLVLSVSYAIFDRYQKKTELREKAAQAPAPLRILIEEGQWFCPTILIYTDFGIKGQEVIFAVWRSGRIVWSENKYKGGQPYFDAKISSEKVSKVLNELEDSVSFNDPFLNVINIEVHPKLEVISIVGVNKVLCMEVSHKFKGDGLVEGAPKHYSGTYYRIRNLVESLIPAQGREFDFKYKIVGVFRY